MKQQEDGQPRRLPYDDPTYVAMHLERKMTPADFVAVMRSGRGAAVCGAARRCGVKSEGGRGDAAHGGARA
jgi:hypothetical protein